MSTQAEGIRRFAARRNAERWQWNGDRVIVVAGARREAGASTVASLLSLASAADGRRTLIVDANDTAAAQHRLLGVETSDTILQLQEPSLDIDKLLAPVNEHCWLLPCAHPVLDNARAFGPAERRTVLRRVAQLYNAFDVVIIDAGSKLDGVIASAGRGAWRFVAVAGAEPVGLASAYAMVKAVDTRWRGVPVELLVNRCDEPGARAAFDQVRAGAKHFLDRDVGFTGSIPADGAVAGAARDGLPLQSLLNESVAGQGVKRIAVRLLAELDDAARS